jgi:alcohol dehydrogenase/L-iditol 2-dehydrogenase
MTQRTQTAVVHYELRELAVELRRMPVPEIGDGDVLLEVGAVSVCGSDVHQAYNRHSWRVNLPVILGHEFSGTVAKKGKNVAHFREGDRVVSETAAEICGACLMCRSGRYNLCPSRRGFGYGVHGAMTSYVKVPWRCLHHIPDDVPLEHACLSEPCAVAYHAMCVNAVVRPGDLVVVVGPGPIGLLCARLAALGGADPLVVAGRRVDEPRLQIARKLGATRTVDVDAENLEEVVRGYQGLGAEVVCDASGSSQPLELCLRLVQPGGRIVKVGWSPDRLPLDINPLVQKNVTLQGSFSHSYLMWEKVIHLLHARRLMPELLIGLNTGLGDWRSAFAAMHEGAVLKAVLVPEKS